MNSNTLHTINALRHCEEIRNRLYTTGGRYRSSSVRKIPGMDTVDLSKVWSAMQGGNPHADEALATLQDSACRTVLSLICCSADPDNFTSEIISRQPKFACGKNVLELLATTLEANNRRFPETIQALESLTVASPYSICGVDVDIDFSEALYMALRNSANMHDVPLPSVGSNNDANTLSWCIDVLGSGTASFDSIFEQLQSIDPHITNKGKYTLKGLVKHINRIACRLWYDRGIVVDAEDTLKRIVCRVANTLRLKKKYSSLLVAYFNFASNIISFDDEIDVESILFASVTAKDAILTLFDDVEKVGGGDVGLMFRLDQIDDSEYLSSSSLLSERISHFENGLLEVTDAGVIVHNSVSKFGSTLDHSKTESGATVALPPSSESQDEDDLFFNVSDAPSVAADTDIFTEVVNDVEAKKKA